MTDAPKRIQLRRTKGWRIPKGAVIVDRRSKWGNWYKPVQVGSGYRATLHARSDFGCNLHAPAAAESDHQ